MIGEKCAVYDCKSMVVARGLCNTHYKRWHRHGHILQTRSADWGSRERHPLYKNWCHLKRFYYPKGLVAKEWIDDFWLFANEVKEHPGPRLYYLSAKDESIPLGPSNWYWRKAYSENTPEQKAKARERARQRWKENPERAIDMSMRRYYGITYDDYKKMHECQNGVCDICKKPETSVDHKYKKIRRLAVDHCHKTQKIRALLCSNCNKSLGGFCDDISLLQSAIDYLKKHQT